MPTFHFYRGNAPAKPLGTPLKLETDVLSGVKNLEGNFGAPNSLESDLLGLAAAIFAVDRGQKRGEREEFARNLEIHVPVVNVGRLQPLMQQVERTLRLLSNDMWSITLVQEQGTLAGPPPKVTNPGKVLLFSGGLDSLAAAVEFSQDPLPLALVSHTTKNSRTSNIQQSLFEMLQQKGRNVEHYSYFVSSKNKNAFVHDCESSQRTRSFVFLVLAAISAVRLARREILLMAENGQMAIHLPLSSARMAAFSTHTAHPDVLVEMQSFLSAALEVSFKITNPYVSKTKREVIQPIISVLPDAVALSNSCWKNSRTSPDATHCGECIPCFVRRIAIESYGPDLTAYGRDVFGEDFGRLAPEDEGRRNLADLAEFTINFEKLSDQELFDEWPELYSANIDPPSVIAMYRRAASETRKVLSKYRGGKQVLV